MSLKCIECNSPLMKPSKDPNPVFALTCGNEKCKRYGLLTVVGKQEKSDIITPGQKEFEFKGEK